MRTERCSRAATARSLPEFQADRAAALERYLKDVPDGPDISGAQRVSKVIGMTNYPCVSRDPTPAPGLVLVGDAANTGDPMPAVGCGWAFRSAEWLVESTTPALRGLVAERDALAAYRRRMRFIVGHDRLDRQAALGRPMNGLQRAITRGARVDPVVGRRAYLFGMRAIPASGLLNPPTIARALLAAARAPRTR